MLDVCKLNDKKNNKYIIYYIYYIYFIYFFLIPPYVVFGVRRVQRVQNSLFLLDAFLNHSTAVLVTSKLKIPVRLFNYDNNAVHHLG